MSVSSLKLCACSRATKTFSYFTVSWVTETHEKKVLRGIASRWFLIVFGVHLTYECLKCMWMVLLREDYGDALADILTLCTRQEIRLARWNGKPSLREILSKTAQKNMRRPEGLALMGARQSVTTSLSILSIFSMFFCGGAQCWTLQQPDDLRGSDPNRFSARLAIRSPVCKIPHILSKLLQSSNILIYSWETPHHLGHWFRKFKKLGLGLNISENFYSAWKFQKFSVFHNRFCWPKESVFISNLGWKLSVFLIPFETIRWFSSWFLFLLCFATVHMPAQ